MAGMDATPNRRWFRFRLSTVLILTAIVAWTMATPRELWIAADHTDELRRIPSWLVVSKAYVEQPPGSAIVCREYAVVLNPNLFWPLGAIAAFLAWKAAWAVVERRRRASAAPE
jgi:hypothetical protein